MAHHNGEDTPVDHTLGQPGLKLKLTQGTLACDQLSNTGAEEASHCRHNACQLLLTAAFPVSHQCVLDLKPQLHLGGVYNRIHRLHLYNELCV